MSPVEKYQEIDRAIEPITDGYRVRVLDSPSGQADGRFTLPFTQDELRGLARWQTGRTQETLTPETFGTRLFHAVFSGAVGDCLRRSQAKLSSDEGLRINLRLNDAPELSSLAWESLYDPSHRRFLALSERSPVVRYLALPLGEPSIRVEFPLRVLALISNPANYDVQLNVEREWQKLNEALAPLIERNVIVLDRIDIATWANLQAFLRRYPTHILHFVGHGFYDQEQQEGGLILETREERWTPVLASKLGPLLHNHTSLRLVVLNACQGATSSAFSPFSGVAQRLVQQGVPAVIAMQWAVSDDVATVFSHNFYAAIADGYAVDTALTQARMAVYKDYEVEWATPVLFMRSRDGKLFDIQSFHEPAADPEEKAEPPSTPLPAHRPPASPFVGTVPFRSEQAALFFGREERVRELIDKIENEYSLWLVINGLSGAGKTSLLRAALQPKLQERGYSVVYSSILDTPEQNVIDAIRRTFPQRNHPTSDLVDAVNQIACKTGKDLVLIVDQLERCFTLARSNAAREQFWRNMARLLNGASPCLVKVIFAIRADWLYAIQEESNQLQVGIFNYLYMLEPLTPGEAMRALTGPLDLFEIAYDPLLIEEIVRDLTDEGYVNPPHLQIIGETLYRSYRQTDRSQIDRALYRELGGCDTIIRSHFENVVNSLGPNAQVCWQILLRLVDGEDLRVSKREEELRGELSAQQFESIVQHLINHSILIREISAEDNQPVYTLTHDSLVEELNKYVESNEKLRRWQIAQHYLHTGYSDWQSSRDRTASQKVNSPLLLDEGRYLYIWENREVFGALTPEHYEYLMRCALKLSHSSFGYWLDRRIAQPDEDVAPNAAQAANADDTRSVRRKLLQSLVAESLLADDVERQRATRVALVRSLRQQTISDETAAALAALLLEPESQASAAQQRKVVAPVLWSLRRHLSPADALRTAPVAAGVWLSEHSTTVLASVGGSLAAAAVVAILVLVNLASHGTWSLVPPFHAGDIAAAAFVPGTGDIFAVTRGGAEVGDSSALAFYDADSDSWTIRSKNLTPYTVNTMLVLDGDGSRRIYVSLAGTGLIRSDDDGESWQQINAGLRSYDIYALVADPDDPDVIYAGSRDHKGIYRSENGGDTWQEISGNELYAAAVLSMVVAGKGADQRLVIGTGDGQILKHLPTQDEWQPLYSIPGLGMVDSMTIEEEERQIIYAGTSTGRVLRSEDGGEIWEIGDREPTVFEIDALSVAPGVPNRVYRSTFGFGGHILWVSGDFGETWTPVANNDNNRQYVRSLLVSSSNPDHLYTIGMAGFFEIADEGRTWKRHDLGAPLSPLQRVEASTVPDGPIYVVAGGSLFFARVGAKVNWRRGMHLPALSVRDLAIDPTNPDRALAAVYLPQSWPIYETLDGGQTWRPANETSPLPMLGDDVTVLEWYVDNEGQHLYAGTNGCGVVYSSDGGHRWEGSGGHDCNLDENEPRNVIDMAVDPHSTARLFVAADNTTIYVTEDRGHTWRNYTVGIQNQIYKIAADPLIPNRLYLIAGSDRFLRSDDGGKSWQQYVEGLQNIALVGMAVLPEREQTVVVAADNGEIWKSTNGGASWRSIRENLKVSDPSFLTYDPQRRDLLLSSHSGVIYRYRPGPLEDIGRQ